MSDLNNDTSNKKQRLGRGLGSLLGGHAANVPTSGLGHFGKNQDFGQGSKAPIQTEKPAAAPAPLDIENKVWTVAVDKLVPGEFQPRKSFEKEPLQELSQSIKENGILQPIIVRKRKAGGYEIIAGERRWRAAQLAGLHEVPVLIKDYSNEKTLELSIIENIQREDLNPIEEAEAYHRLASEFSLTQQQIAEKVGKDRATVANSLRVLTLPNEVLEMIKEKTLTLGHAKVLLSVDDSDLQVKFAKRCREGKVSVRQLEKQIQSKKKQSPAVSEFEQRKQSAINNVAEMIQKKLGTKVNIEYHKGQGKIQIHFYSDEEFNSLTQKMT